MRLRAVLIVLCLASLIVTVPVAPRHAKAFVDHKSITREGMGDGQGLTFLREPVLASINAQHDWMDGGLRLGHDEKHFDDCEFDKSAKWIRDRYLYTRLALEDVNPWVATVQFGRALHPVQDFYSHSNWVELLFDYPDDRDRDVAQSDLVDLSGAQSSLASPWYAPYGEGSIVRDDIVLGGDDWPGPEAGWTITQHGGGVFVPTLIDPSGETRFRMLTSGASTGEGECDVDDFSSFKHKYLNKDCPTCSEAAESDVSADEKVFKYEIARDLALMQTGYEWCRLVRKAHLADRDGLLLAMWVRRDGNPHPPDTPCGPAPKGPTPVTVTIESIQVLHDHDASLDDPGEIQLAAVLYDDPLDFHRSIHFSNRSGPMELNDQDFVPGPQLPEPQTLCVSQGQGASFTLHAWDNDEEFAGTSLETEYDNVFDDDDLLVGFRREFGSQLPTGVQVAGSAADLEVHFRVTRFPAGATTNPCPAPPT